MELMRMNNWLHGVHVCFPSSFLRQLDFGCHSTVLWLVHIKLQPNNTSCNSMSFWTERKEPSKHMLVFT